MVAVTPLPPPYLFSNFTELVVTFVIFTLNPEFACFLFVLVLVLVVVFGRVVLVFVFVFDLFARRKVTSGNSSSLLKSILLLISNSRSAQAERSKLSMSGLLQGNLTFLNVSADRKTNGCMVSISSMV